MIERLEFLFNNNMIKRIILIIIILMIKLKIKQLRLIKKKLSDFQSYIYNYELIEGDLLFLESHGCKDRHDIYF